MTDLYDLQDVARCYLCETPTPVLYCRFCEKNLCTNCQKTHVLDDSKKHKVVPFERRKSLTYCKRHSSNLNDHYCERCRNPICELCVSSEEPEGHYVVDILIKLKSQEEAIHDDLQELDRLENEYNSSTHLILHLKKKLKENSHKMITALRKHGEDWHREINNIIDNLLFELEIDVSSQQSYLDEQENEVIRTITQMKQIMVVLKKILDTKDDKSVLAYESANSEFKCLPKFKVSFPGFCHQKINREQLKEQFGYLNVSNVMISEERDFKEPHIIANININTQVNDLCSISCLSDENVWVCECRENIIKLYNFQGSLVKSVPTKSGNMPRDISVTKSGDLLYTDYVDKSVYIVNDKGIQEIIKLKRWKPCSVCCTTSGDLLVVMDNDDNKETKIVRYSDSIEKQSIQFDDRGRPLYSSGGNVKYVAENRNLDICVSDRAAHSVVVVNKSGSLRFVYPSFSTTNQLFTPYCITTDSQGRILTADYNNNCIHILDQDGQFLRFINNCDIQNPWGLCLDTKGNLIVAENRSSKIKKINYCKTI